MNHPKVAIIVPVFNGLEFTRKCLPGLYELIGNSGKPKEQVPIVVVDDGSSDGTHQWVSKHYPEVHLLKGDGGLWWSGGVNMGMKYALERLKADYVLWWNNDIIPQKDYLTQLFRILTGVSDKVVVGSKVYVLNGALIWGMGGRFDPVKGTRFMYGERERDGERYQQPFQVDWLPGMGTTIHRSVIEAIGYLDEHNFPQYHADSDYSLRAKSAGFQIMAFPELVIFNDNTNTGIFHQNSYSRLFQSLTSIKSIYGIKRDLRFLQTHSTSYRAYLPFAKKYYKYIGGFLKWKMLNALGVKKRQSMKVKAYLYPITNRLKTGIYNPYLDHFMEATEGYVTYLNRHAPSDTGIFNLVKFAGKADMVFLNWIENLPEKKAGWLQTVFFLIFLRIKNWLGIRVVWTLHNKISHSAQHRHLKELLFRNLLKYSDLIITHSREGVRFASENYPQASSRLFFFPHPVTPVNANQLPRKKEYDLLIWGTMAPYKGIHTFLEYLEQQNALSRYRILIAGKAVTPEFFQKINQYSSPGIIIKNQFIDSGELSQMIARSSIVLFTYSGASVLSSGALMDSISNRAFVVGPHIGAFAEMADLGIIRTYHDFEGLQAILEASKSHFHTVTAQKVEKFIREHTWPEFGKALQPRVIGLLDCVTDQQERSPKGASSAPHLLHEQNR